MESNMTPDPKKSKKYRVDMLRWEPQFVQVEVEAYNPHHAKLVAAKRVRNGDFEQAEIDNSLTCKTELRLCEEI